MRARSLPRGVAIGVVLSLATVGPAAGAGFFWADTFSADAPDARWRLSLEGESVGDRVDQAPNAPGGGYEPARTRPRYASGALAIDWRPSDYWRMRASVGRRTINFLRDSYTVDGLHVGIGRRLPSPSPKLGLELVLDLDAGRADELYKNSWTEVGDASLRGASLFDVRDTTLMASLVAIGQIGLDTSVVTMLGVGRTRATHGSLDGNALDADGCKFHFEASGGNGDLELIEPCNSLVAHSEEYANERGIEDRLGLAPSLDLEHEGTVMQVGTALTHTFGRVELMLGYVYRWHDRDAIDDRLRERGEPFVNNSHTTSVSVGFDIGGGLGLSSGVHYRSTTYLDELPLLYNAFTSERFSGNTLSFGGALTYAF